MVLSGWNVFLSLIALAQGVNKSDCQGQSSLLECGLAFPRRTCGLLHGLACR